jgi:hypothetical protein
MRHWFLECFRRKQLISKLTSSMSHKAKELGRHCGRNKKESLSLGSYQAMENSVFSVLRGTKSNGRTFVT